MNKITKLTFMTAAMLLLSAQAVYAENAPAETTEATTVAPAENDADNHENEVVEEYQPKEEPFTGFTSRDGVTYYHVNNVPITSQWRKINEKWYYSTKKASCKKVQSLTVIFSKIQEKWHKTTLLKLEKILFTQMKMEEWFMTN